MTLIQLLIILKILSLKVNSLCYWGKRKRIRKTSSIKYVEKEINDLLDAGLSLSAASTYLSKNSYSKNFIYNLCKDIR